jgi:hypothetical protein
MFTTPYIIMFFSHLLKYSVESFLGIAVRVSVYTYSLYLEAF